MEKSDWEVPLAGRLGPRGTAAVFFILGLALVLYAAYCATTELAFSRDAVHTRGVVTGLDCDSEGAHIVFRFKDDGGQAHEVRTSWSEQPPRYHVGHELPVAYSAHDPTQAHVDVLTTGPRVFFMILGGVGLVFLLAGLFALMRPAGPGARPQG